MTVVVQRCNVGLQTKRVLIKGDKLGVSEQRERRAFDGGEVASDEQRRCHDAPHAKVGAVFLGGERAAHFEHVHVVVVAFVAVGAHVEVLGQDALHRTPAVVDVVGGAPRECHIVHPGAGIVPSAHVHPYIGAPSVLDGFADGGVALLRVKGEALRVLRSIATTEVDLDEVETTLVEIEIGIVLVVAVEAHVDAQHVAIVVVAAGVATGIAVDASLQSLRVDVVGHGLQSMGEALRMDEQLARSLVAPSKEAVVDVDVVEAHGLQALRHHGVGLPLD